MCKPKNPKELSKFKKWIKQVVQIPEIAEVIVNDYRIGRLNKSALINLIDKDIPKLPINKGIPKAYTTPHRTDPIDSDELNAILATTDKVVDNVSVSLEDILETRGNGIHQLLISTLIDNNHDKEIIDVDYTLIGCEGENLFFEVIIYFDVKD